MGTLIEIGLWNAAVAALLALLAAAVARLARRPALTHTLWLLVLVKLVTPPLVPFSLAWPAVENPSPPVGEEVAVAPEWPADPGPVDPDPPPAEAKGEDVRLPEPPLAEPAAAPIPWHLWIGAAWLAGSALWAGWAALHVARFRCAPARGRRPASLRDEAEELRAAAGTAALPGRLAGPRRGFADGLAHGAASAPAVSVRPAGAAGRRGAGGAAGPRAGPPAAARPLGTAAGVGGDRAVLVAAGPLVGAARAARGGGAVLRRLGGVGPWRRRPALRPGAVAGGGVRVTRPIAAARGG